MIERLRFVFFGLFGFGSLLVTGCTTFQRVTAEPIRMTVVDSTTGQPLADVLAIYHLEATEGTWTGHGGRRAQLTIVEVSSDQNGVLNVPAQPIHPEPFWSYRNPAMYIFKSGYMPAVVQNEWRIIPTLPEVLRWEKNETVVRLQKAESFEKYVKGVDVLKNDLRELYEWPNSDLCGWKMFPKSIIALEQEAMSFEMSGKRKHNSTILRDLLGNEAVSGTKNKIVSRCGSPNKFFQAYTHPCPDGTGMMTEVRRRVKVDQVSGVGTRDTLYTVGKCPVGKKYWMYKEGEGWSVREDLSLDFIKDKRYSQYCESVSRFTKGGFETVGALKPNKQACAVHCRKYCRDNCECLYGGEQVSW